MFLRRALSTSASKALFLGFDSSTQGLKATAVDSALNTVYSAAINYDRDLPHYGTKGGFHQNGQVVTAPTGMLADAVTVLLNKMASDAFPFSQVAALSGSGQQHGSVYWAPGAEEVLKNLRPGLPLSVQLMPVLATTNSPIWRDSSTTAQCRALEAAVAGGASEVAARSGSRAYERFTGNQIKKMAMASPAVFARTERVSLISSFLASLFSGHYAPIDTSDGAGMNILNIHTQAWDAVLVKAYDLPGLEAKLGAAVPAHSVVGTVSSFFQEAYHFSPECKVVAFSGDNPNSVAGLGLNNPGDVGLSLGTSDTIFSIVDAKASKPGLEGHFFVNPVDPKSHMAMLCYKNGSLARENVRNRVAGGSWEKFNSLIKEAPSGNNGQIGFFIDEPEIIPSIPKTGVRYFNAKGVQVASLSPAAEARAVVEGQFLSMRLHTHSVGLEPKAIIATGGGSANPILTQVVADVFGTVVKASNQTDSASLGAAYRALHGFQCAAGPFVPFAVLLDSAPSHAQALHVVATPNAAAHAVYAAMLPAYAAAEAAVVKSCAL